jgi:hypothetical protein
MASVRRSRDDYDDVPTTVLLRDYSSIWSASPARNASGAAADCPKIAANRMMDLCGVIYPDRIEK